jgi:hypothetical protein
MSAEIGIDYYGLKTALKEINKIDPMLRRQITKDIVAACEPILVGIRDTIPLQGPTRGFRNNYGRTGWQGNQQKKVTAKLDTRKARKRNLAQGAQFESIAVVKITAKGAPLNMADMAGRGPNQTRNKNPLRARPNFAGLLTDKLGRGPSRFIWAGGERYLDDVAHKVDQIVIEVMDKTTQNIVRR